MSWSEQHQKFNNKERLFERIVSEAEQREVKDEKREQDVETYKQKPKRGTENQINTSVSVSQLSSKI